MLHTVCCILYASIWKPTLKLVGRKSSFDFVINPIFDFVSKVIILDDDWPFDNFESKTSVFIFFRSDRKDKPDVRTVIFSEWKSFVFSKDVWRKLQFYSDFTKWLPWQTHSFITHSLPPMTHSKMIHAMNLQNRVYSEKYFFETNYGFGFKILFASR